MMISFSKSSEKPNEKGNEPGIMPEVSFAMHSRKGYRQAKHSGHGQVHSR